MLGVRVHHWCRGDADEQANRTGVEVTKRYVMKYHTPDGGKRLGEVASFAESDRVMRKQFPKAWEAGDVNMTVHASGTAVSAVYWINDDERVTVEPLKRVTTVRYVDDNGRVKKSKRGLPEGWWAPFVPLGHGLPIHLLTQQKGVLLLALLASVTTALIVAGLELRKRQAS